MKKKTKAKIFLEAAVVIAVALALSLPGSAVVANKISTIDDSESIYKSVAINKVLPTPTPLFDGEDVLISSDNDGDDEKPKITVNDEGVIVVTYQRESGMSSTTIPVVYSDNDGQSWIMQFLFDSIEFQEGSGVLESPDIKYCPEAEQFFWQAIDPLAEMYNEELAWIPGDIANAQEALWYGLSGQDSIDYTEGALTYVGEWLVGLAIETNYGIIGAPGLAYMYYDEGVGDVFFPNEIDPSWAAGYYYDGQSVLETAPASKPEMATGDDCMYMVMERYNSGEGYAEIAFKATVTDMDPESDTFLYTSGGGPGGMDKYADIEVWPEKQEYVATNATDPDISAYDNVVAIVYSQDGNVKCSASVNDGDDWEVTTVATGAGFPSVFVTEGKIWVAYVQSGDLFLILSEDDGSTWGDAVQINDVDGSVVEIPGTVDIGALGIAWTDGRNGDNDIYFEYAELGVHVDKPELVIDSISGGLGVSAVIKNIGAAVATDVEWTIHVTGGILGLIDKEVTGNIETIAVDGEEPINSGIVGIGLGAVEIAITAECAEGVSAEGTADGTQILFFTIV